jgi:hypothetical protein
VGRRILLLQSGWDRTKSFAAMDAGGSARSPPDPSGYLQAIHFQLKIILPGLFFGDRH